jgi:23S rRNA (uracil1939-C5)-methyltransferase
MTSKLLSPFHCQHLSICSGCTLQTTSSETENLKQQQTLKSDDFKNHLKNLKPFGLAEAPEIIFHSLGSGGFRERADLLIENGKVCFYKKKELLSSENRSSQSFAIQECLQLTPVLQQALKELTKIEWPIAKGSLRIRALSEADTSSSLRLGLWLDFSNLDVKKLFDEKAFLQNLSQKYFIEIGQRRKQLVFKNQTPHLVDPAPQAWSTTWIENHPRPLFLCIGGFSQAGAVATQKIVQLLESTLKTHLPQKSNHCVEFGSGAGTLTFPLANIQSIAKVTACENDPIALLGLEKGLKKLASEDETNPAKNILEKINIQKGDFQKSSPDDFFKGVDVVVVNPPRSGLKGFLDGLFKGESKPQLFFYMSCFAESWFEDSKKLLASGYNLAEAHLVDQFPQTPHYEIISVWKR